MAAVTSSSGGGSAKRKADEDTMKGTVHAFFFFGLHTVIYNYLVGGRKLIFKPSALCYPNFGGKCVLPLKTYF